LSDCAAAYYETGQELRRQQIATPAENSTIIRGLAEFGHFLLANQEEITRRWVTAVDRSPEVAASEDLTYRQLLDHLPSLCIELASILKQPDAQSVRDQAARDAGAHGRKRWQQGYNLEELIREICLIRRNFFETWPAAYAAKNESFEGKTREAARQVADRFFDNLIIDSTVQFVGEHSDAVRKIEAELMRERLVSADAKSDVLRHVSHTLREPLSAIVFAADALVVEPSLSAEGHDNVRVILRNAKLEGDKVEELLLAAQLFFEGRGKGSRG
jgi:signal transduction histidine kinase